MEELKLDAGSEETTSHQMGMHTEQLAGRTQQVYFDAEETENFTYPFQFDVDSTSALNSMRPIWIPEPST